MDYLIVFVEQLDRASDELVDGSAVAGRLALILTDNVVELLMHRRCEEIFRREAASDSNPAKAGRYSGAARARVLGQRFDEKYKFLLSEGLISQQEVDFIRVCHAIRGEAYHAGMTHDGFVRELAAEYFSLACTLLARLQPSWRTSSPTQQHGPRLQRHLTSTSDFLGDRYLGTSVEHIVESLLARRPQPGRNLPAALADTLAARLEGIEANLEFLVEEDPDSQGSRERELVELQRWADLYSSVPLDVQQDEAKYSAFLQQRRVDMDSTWRPKLEQLPMEAWKSRAGRFGHPLQ